MIDIHSHILPAIDDGSKSIKMTIEMLKNAVKEETTEIIATPHFCRGYAESNYEEVKKLSKSINKLAKDEGININVYYGQEIYYSKNIISDYRNGTIGTLADSKYLLFELPLQGKFEREILENIYELQVMGLQPILAHPERYKFLKEKSSLINEFVDEGVLFQMNAGSIKGVFGRDSKKLATLFLQNGIYNFIGSDAHNTTNRITGIKEESKLAVSKNKIYKKLFEESAKNILKNEDIEFYGERIKERKIFGFFK